MTRLNETCLTLRRNALEREAAREGRGTPPWPPGPAPRARRAGHGGLGAAVLLALWVLLWGHFLVAIAAPAGRLGPARGAPWAARGAPAAAPAAAAPAPRPDAGGAEAGAPPRLAAAP
jgi:hypothetical protein